jgi:hypothetical protein
MITAGMILKRNLMSEVGRGAVIGDPSQLPEMMEDFDPWREAH